MERDGKRIAIVCGNCGSDDVCRDAWARWDIGAQDWVLGSVFDDGHCNRCDAESSLIEVELAPMPRISSPRT